MVLYVLNQNFNIIGTIDNYSSIIWRRSYSEVGDFELCLAPTPEVVALLQKNNYIVRTDDIKVENNIISYHNVMIIKNFDLNTDFENGDEYIVTGRELKYLLHQRIVWSQTNLTGSVENAIRRLVNENAIAPTDPNRVIPNLVLGAESRLSDNIEKQITGDYLDEAISEICVTYTYGWEIFITNNQLVFRVYKGLDRSYAQTERPYVVFSPDFDNLYKSEWQINTEQYANTTLIGGEGEGTERVYATVGNERSGLDRCEVFTDARDLSSNDGAITPNDYLNLLKERGKDKLAELSYTEGFSGEVVADLSFIYGRDYYIGDKVTIINEYGVTRDVYITSVIESQDDSGITYIPQFNI